MEMAGKEIFLDALTRQNIATRAGLDFTYQVIEESVN